MSVTAVDARGADQSLVYDVIVEPGPEFLRIIFTGEFSVPRTVRAFDRVAEEATRHAVSKVLLDARAPRQAQLLRRVDRQYGRR